MTTDQYHPLLVAPAEPGGFSNVNVITLQEQIHACGATHVRSMKGVVWKIFQLLNKKSVPLNNSGDGPQRMNFGSVESFGIIGGEAITLADEGPEADAHEGIDGDTSAEPQQDAAGQTFGQHLQAVIDGQAAPGEWQPAATTAAENPATTGGHQDRAHAVLSASGAHRWINCPPSALLEADRPDTTSHAADQGTAAHELAEHKIRKALKHRTDRPTSPWQDDEMEDLTDIYRDYILEQYRIAQTLTDDAQLFIEQRVDFSHLVPDGFGTADAVIIGDGTMQVIDLKYGQGVQVNAAGNPQGRLYALGALNLFDLLYDIQQVVITIYQPRRDNISSETLTVEDLEQWAQDVVAPAAALAATGDGDFAAGDWCGFCKIKNTCRARAEKNLQVAQWEFDPPVELTDDEIAEALRLIPEAKKWMADVEKFAARAAIEEGRQWPGFKLVAGRSIRAYTDPDEVAQAAAAAGYTDVWDRKLIGITAMEKLMGKPTFAEVLGDLVHKPEGKPTLVPESDGRPPIAPHTAEADFA